MSEAEDTGPWGDIGTEAEILEAIRELVPPGRFGFVVGARPDMWLDVMTRSEIREVVAEWRSRRVAAVPRHSGRPGYTDFQRRYLEARERAPSLRPQDVADNFELLDGTVGTSADHLGFLRRKYGQRG